MDAQFERRLLFSMNGQSSISAYSSPIQSPIKSSDRYIPLRSSLSASNLHYPLNSPSSSSSSSSSLRRLQSSPTSSTTPSPSKKCKYEENSIGLSAGVTASQPDLAVYEQLLQNTLLNTDMDSLMTVPDVQPSKTVKESKQSAIGKEKFRSIFRYSERRNKSQLVSSSINKQHLNRSPISNASIHLLYSPKKTTRHIPELPYKVLDAPDLQDDFYLNLVDWSSSNILSVGLGNCVYIYNAQSNQVQLLSDLSQTPLPMLNHNQLNIVGSDAVTSVQWSHWSNILAVGTHRGYIHIYDVSTRKRVQSICKHSNRVGVLAWSERSLCSGSRDRTIIEHDIRQKATVQVFHGHTQEVCGLKWSPDKSILASGGNDNHLNLWSKSQPSRPLHSFHDHLAAVKAIAWSPHHHGLLASGGGSADRHIRFRSSLTCQTLNVCDTGSQVCQLIWSKNSANELVSTHGFAQNQVVVWKYPTMQPLAKLLGHQHRVLYLAMSPDGESIVTGAGDETLRFWNVFAKAKSMRHSDSKFNGLRQMR